MSHDFAAPFRQKTPFTNSSWRRLGTPNAGRGSFPGGGSWLDLARIGGLLVEADKEGGVYGKRGKGLGVEPVKL